MSRRGLLVGAGALFASMPFVRTVFAQEDKVLVIACTADITHFDPHVGADHQSTFIMRNVYDTLIGVSSGVPTPTPRLADSWEVSPDGLTYTFKLNPTAKFHTGEPVDAAAVKYSFDRLRAVNRGNSWMIANVVGDDSIEIVDPHTVVFHLKEAFAPFLQVLPFLAIVNPAIIEANRGDDFGQSYLLKATAGSGPFELVRFEPSDIFVLRRVADGWRQGGGNLTGCVFKVVRETATQRLMVERGEAHIAVDLNSSDLDGLRGKPGVNLVIEPDYKTFLLRLNTRHGPLADKNLRKAISYAFDYDAMLDVAGYADLLNGPIPSHMFGHSSGLTPYRQDLDKAREYLAKSAYPEGGITLKLTYSSSLDQQRRWAAIMLDSLRPLNINVEILPIRWADLQEMVKTPETTPDIASIYEASNYGDPDNIAFPAFHSSRNGNWQNPTYANPEVDEVIMAARFEPDEAKRKELYAKFQELVVEDASDIFGVNEKVKLAVRDNVQNFEFTPVVSTAIDIFPLSLS